RCEVHVVDVDRGGRRVVGAEVREADAADYPGRLARAVLVQELHVRDEVRYVAQGRHAELGEPRAVDRGDGDADVLQALLPLLCGGVRLLVRGGVDAAGEGEAGDANAATRTRQRARRSDHGGLLAAAGVPP